MGPLPKSTGPSSHEDPVYSVPPFLPNFLQTKMLYKIHPFLSITPLVRCTYGLGKAKYSSLYSWIFLHVLHRLLARKCWVGWNWKPWLPVGLLGTWPITIWCNDPMAFCASWQSRLYLHKPVTAQRRWRIPADSVFLSPKNNGLYVLPRPLATLK